MMAMRISNYIYLKFVGNSRKRILLHEIDLYMF